MDRQQRCERAASVLAEVSALLQEVRAQQYFVERSPAESQRQRAEQLLEHLERLHVEKQAASEQLILMAIRETDPEVRRLPRSSRRP